MIKGDVFITVTVTLHGVFTDCPSVDKVLSGFLCFPVTLFDRKGDERPHRRSSKDGTRIKRKNLTCTAHSSFYP